jgi:hypothetical protein
MPALTLEQEEIKKELFKKVKLNKTTPNEIELLLNKLGAIDINMKNAWQETLIYNCAKHAVNIKLMEWLYGKGCDPTIINTKKYNAYNACLNYNYKKNKERVFDWLFTKGIKIEKEYPELPEIHNIIICYPDTETYEWLIKKYNINEIDKNGNTPLHISCHQDTRHNSPTPCKWLSSNGANINAQNNDGDTSLHLACKSGFSNCIRILLENGADKTIKNKLGKIPQDLILENKDTHNKWSGDYKESLEFLTNGVVDNYEED